MTADSVLDEDTWGRLSQMIRAAHEENRETLLVLMRSFAQEALPAHQCAGLYVWYLLRNAIAEKVGGRAPTDAELTHISRDYFAGFSVLVDADRSVLEDTFRKVCERPPLNREIRPGDLLVLGPAALGVLYEDPDAELERMKPRLINWWQKYGEKFHSQGVLRYGSCSSLEYGSRRRGRGRASLTDLGAREYNSGTASFISPDPLLDPGDPQDLNAYAYAGDSPPSSEDPSGAMQGGEGTPPNPCGVDAPASCNPKGAAASTQGRRPPAAAAARAGCPPEAATDR
jgi:RHS repeat-associated protein